MKNSFYFDHDYNARNDLKILQLRAETGTAGYGLFWMVVEVMAEQGGYIKREALAGLSIGLSQDLASLKQFIDYCISIELFEEEKNGVYSKRIIKHINFREALSNAGRLGGRGNKREAKGRLKGGFSQVKATPEAGKERKGKEIKGKEIKEIKDNSDNSPVFKNCVEIYFEKYKTQVGITPSMTPAKGAALKQLIAKIEKTIWQNGSEAPPGKVIDAFRALLEKLPSWYAVKLDISVINSKYDEIIAEIRGAKSKVDKDTESWARVLERRQREREEAAATDSQR